VPQDLVAHVMIDDEGDDPHLDLTPRVLRTILLYLIDESLEERRLVSGRC
jgi:hypothetical protein